MKKIAIVIFTLIFPSVGLVVAEPGSNVTQEEMIQKGIMSFRKDMTSEDEDVRKKAFDLPMIEQGLGQMRENTISLKQELDKSGPIQSVELIDVRKKDEAGIYEDLIKIIPENIPLYRAITKDEQGSSGSRAP